MVFVEPKTSNPPQPLDEITSNSSLQDIRDRHDDILQLEHELRELNNLFRDTANLVAEQGETIDTIVYHFDTIRENAATTEKDMNLAQKYTKGCCRII